ncbi:MAG: VWA domain-containing protein, partial [Proteobacteria bacterium]
MLPERCFTITAMELVFSFTGFKTVRVKVDKSTRFNVKMTADNQSLQEVVVIGYNADAEHERKTSSRKDKSISETLVGRVQGIQIQTASPSVSGANTIIRGVKSVDKNDDVLYVVDGKVTSATDFKKIKPEEMKSVNVIKGAQATALHGSQGANGVIIVDTVRGSQIVPGLTEPDDESYDGFIENAFTSPKNEPLSTFSIDVDNASYT